MKINELIINTNWTIREAVKKLDETAKKILLVVEEERLVGVITDGDIRRWILKNGSLGENVKFIINTSPKVLKEKNISKARHLMKLEKIEAIPIVNKGGKVEDIIFWNDTLEDKFISREQINVPVVIMAGGKGTRLYPYTQILPKPLIPIGGISIVERIINKFNEYGCKAFYLTVNYKKNMIKAYLDDLVKEYQVNYIEEETFLGTGGSLHMLRGIITETFFVSNCDILVDANYADILAYHKKNNNKITMVTSLKNYTIPYGVIQIDNKGCISEMIEKPEYNFQVNTGLYVLEPEVLEEMPQNEFFHITDLINKYIEQQAKVGVYPVIENEWLDMGEIKEMETMIQRLGV